MEISVEFFKLNGYRLVFKTTDKCYKVFFEKFNILDGNKSLKCIPEPLFPLIYKLYKGLTVDDNDIYIMHDRILAKLQEDFKLCAIMD